VNRPGKCVHFRGIQHATCEAGIVMLSVRDASHLGPYVWPCLPPMKPGQLRTTCPQYREPTPEEIAADEAALQARLEEMRGQAERGECSNCGVKVTKVRQAGSCVYAEPCGHRIGQGDARQVAKAMGLP
jgi:hypothetical protein